jgi:hypothetical protein
MRPALAQVKQVLNFITLRRNFRLVRCYWHKSLSDMNKLLLLLGLVLSTVATAPAADVVKTANGSVEGRGVQPSGCGF